MWGWALSVMEISSCAPHPPHTPTPPHPRQTNGRVQHTLLVQTLSLTVRYSIHYTVVESSVSLVVPLAYFTSLPASTESSCPLQPFMAQNIEGVGHHGNGQELWTRISHFFPHHKCQITMISNTVTVALVLDLVHLDPPVHAVLPRSIRIVGPKQQI